MPETAEIIPLTDAHLPTGEIDEEMISILRALLAKAEKGDILGMGLCWVEGQNDIIYSFIPGCARAALMVAAAARLNHEALHLWRAE